MTDEAQLLLWLGAYAAAAVVSLGGLVWAVRRVW